MDLCEPHRDRMGLCAHFVPRAGHPLVPRVSQVKMPSYRRPKNRNDCLPAKSLSLVIQGGRGLAGSGLAQEMDYLLSSGMQRVVEDDVSGMIKRRPVSIILYPHISMMSQ